MPLSGHVIPLLNEGKVDWSNAIFPDERERKCLSATTTTSREEDKENIRKTEEGCRRVIGGRGGGDSGKVKKRKGKKVGDLKGVSGLTGPTSDRQRKKPDDTRS
ncbi:hypothetical protein ALC53_13041 [Atta colombica]|uniref:Uncharacterized protein n=1 Tax=Atta colombica TaxID=520822 RepID=A0A195AX22_9HYME|nr:hypothetical protein ALC53_13041 [Atta colombica]